jgi:hypothetical protein
LGEISDSKAQCKFGYIKKARDAIAGISLIQPIQVVIEIVRNNISSWVKSLKKLKHRMTIKPRADQFLDLKMISKANRTNCRAWFDR